MGGTARLILEHLLEGSQRALAKLREIAAADPELSHDLWHWSAAEEGEDSGDTLGALVGYGGCEDTHDAFSSSWITGGATVIA
jgi:hypothetical protein